MNKQKVTVILLVVAILFSLGSIWMRFNTDNNYVSADSNTNTITTIESDNSNVGIGILPQRGTG